MTLFNYDVNLRD